MLRHNEQRLDDLLGPELRVMVETERLSYHDEDEDLPFAEYSPESLTGDEAKLLLSRAEDRGLVVTIFVRDDVHLGIIFSRTSARRNPVLMEELN